MGLYKDYIGYILGLRMDKKMETTIMGLYRFVFTTP